MAAGVGASIGGRELGESSRSKGLLLLGPVWSSPPILGHIQPSVRPRRMCGALDCSAGP
jgi:hypothetical protein